jgi:hypothetical protein
MYIYFTSIVVCYYVMYHIQSSFILQLFTILSLNI